MSQVYIDEMKTLMEDYKVPEHHQDIVVNEILESGLEHCQEMLDNHKSGGRMYTRDEYLEIQKKRLRLKSQLDSGNVHIKQEIMVKDQISPRNICFTQVENLTEVTIKDLKLGEIIPNSMLWLKLICDACNI